ncbi:hypothetical protein XA68_11451 [Ophiocordyceps unilateralis]|uniref:Coiled-coil domain-containing protein 16 n=1 Tax=Ophiocordyceps unilateralis TaxID=268505 RepID=A0A2A9PGU5_OPHUN|nr:hypothetical protein XA68_11451 [Ophiocordyceps unilateralis]
MADARSLLRQQRAARRIQHPHAAYTDTGKLLCTLCRDQIKAESLWEKHLQSESHRELLSRHDVDDRIAASNPAQKRRLEETDTVDDADGDDSRAEDTLRRKRSKLDVVSPMETVRDQPLALASPSLMRRASTTPSQGVELQIPSRPATPSRRDTPSSSASGAASRRRAGSNLTPTAAPQVDESEWAAFEADVAVDATPYDEGAVISAPAMTAEESAAAKNLLEQAGKMQVDVDLEEEREEAARAMEDEFQDMQELEERVQRLKDRREALRKRSDNQSQDYSAPEKSLSEPGQGKEDPSVTVSNVKAGAGVLGEDADDEDDDDDDDDDDWDGFRFHNS